MSWMREQQAAKRAAQQGNTLKVVAAPTPLLTDTDSNYAIWRSQCNSDWKQLKLIADHAERNRHKPAKLDAYRDYLQTWMDAGETHQNDVLVMNIIWAFDVGEFEWVLTLADYAIQTQQQNTLFKRDISTFLYDELLKGSNDRFKADDRSQESLFLAVLSRIEAEQWKPAPHFIPAASFYRMGGLIAQRDEQWVKALDFYQKADALKDDIGVKGRIAEMVKKVAESAPHPPSDSQDSADAESKASEAESSDSQTVLSEGEDDGNSD